VNKPQAENPLQRIKDAIRVDADAIRQRAAATPAAAPERVLVANPAPHASTRHDVAINELCGFHSVDFIERAFIAVLGRPADENSVQVHLAQLNAGRSKLEILGDLRWSPEGRARAVKMPGLYLRYLLIKLGRVPVLMSGESGLACGWRSPGISAPLIRFISPAEAVDGRCATARGSRPPRPTRRVARRMRCRPNCARRGSASIRWAAIDATPPS
jgi:hypothetical protein